MGLFIPYYVAQNGIKVHESGKYGVLKETQFSSVWEDRGGWIKEGVPQEAILKRCNSRLPVDYAQ